MKYRNKGCIIDGIKFDSTGEGGRYLELKILERQGLIRQLHRQVPYKLFGRGNTVICKIVADFTYFEGEAGVAEDYKGVETKDFRIKEKLFLDNYPGVEFRKSGPWKKIKEAKAAKAKRVRTSKALLARAI